MALKCELEPHYSSLIYQMSWWKDDKPIYQYSPSDKEPIKITPRPGVTVDVSQLFFYLLCVYLIKYLQTTKGQM